MKLIADLHIHSRFSRATSRDLDFVALHRSALLKGIGLVGTGDFTHPGWMAEIEEQLVPAEEGWFKLRADLQRVAEEGVPPSCRGEVRFVLEVEISNIYKKGQKTRKNHNLVFLPSVAAAKAFSQKLAAVGNLASDGRPILGLDARNLLEITLETDPLAFLIPAHIWTPWFSMFGSKSGFDSVSECFSDLASHIFAVETGLSSDPSMNFRIADLDRMTLVSNSDAHSPSKLGREANLLDIEYGYVAMLEALRTRNGFCGTVEFFPEHGKYHLDGHRKCELRLTPEETRQYAGRCPACGGLITVGVMSRVLELSDPARPQGYAPSGRAEFFSLVPLEETVAEVLGLGCQSRKVADVSAHLLRVIGPELYILKDAPLEDIEAVGGAPMGEAVRRIRRGEMTIEAGYDGEFGIVKVFTDKERKELVGQTSFFPQLNPAKDAQPPPPKRARKSPMQSPEQADPSVSELGVALAGQINAEQLRVVTTACGPIIVSAGPGTGKTKTLTERILHQVRAGGWEKSRVLALTFTNQAALELTSRLGNLLDEFPGQPPMVATFHGFGRLVLEAVFGVEVRVADEEARFAIMTQALGGDSSKRRVEAMLDAVSFAKQHSDPIATIAHATTPNEEARLVFERYQKVLAERGLFDLDDLVLAAYSRLARDPEAAQQLAVAYDSISVDEYQDVNDVQAALVKLLSPNGANLLVIGDPDQAIYGFRGSRPGHFTRFREEYSNAQAISLDTTFRLPKPILETSQAILGAPRVLQSNKSGSRVEVVACPSEAAEAEQILLRLEQLLGPSSHFAVDTGRGSDAEEPDLGFGDVAILCRLKTQRAAILTALSRSGIPCHQIGEDEPHDPRAQKVAIMTMHASKGREFEIVFVVGVEPGLVPLAIGELESDSEEERRLLYVAATRAKRRLILSHTKHRMLFGMQLPGGPSPFIEKLPSKHVILRAATLKRKPQKRQLGLF